MVPHSHISKGANVTRLGAASVNNTNIGPTPNIANWELSRDVFHLPCQALRPTAVPGINPDTLNMINKVMEMYNEDTANYWPAAWKKGIDKLPTLPPPYAEFSQTLWKHYEEKKEEFVDAPEDIVEPEENHFHDAGTAWVMNKEVTKGTFTHGPKEANERFPGDFICRVCLGQDHFKATSEEWTIFAGAEFLVKAPESKDMHRFMPELQEAQYKPRKLKSMETLWDTKITQLTQHLTLLKAYPDDIEDIQPMLVLIQATNNAIASCQDRKKNPSQAGIDFVYRFLKDSDKGFVDFMAGVSITGLGDNIRNQTLVGWYDEQRLFTHPKSVDGNLETIDLETESPEAKAAYAELPVQFKLAKQLRIKPTKYKKTPIHCPDEKFVLYLHENKTAHPKNAAGGIPQISPYLCGIIWYNHLLGIHWPVYYYVADGPFGILSAGFFDVASGKTYVLDHGVKSYDLRDPLGVYRLATTFIMISKRFKALANEIKPDKIVEQMKLEKSKGVHWHQSWYRAAALANADFKALADAVLDAKKAEEEEAKKRAAAERAAAEGAEESNEENVAAPVKPVVPAVLLSPTQKKNMKRREKEKEEKQKQRIGALNLGNIEDSAKAGEGSEPRRATRASRKGT
ncbi:hypothetical protein BDN72DRAFT_897360 [Pluteus cervinus]|uniref:Uncharacterized protein n=1 Tax=Pluteus cervinus TaxID=181527 RepID=A0ACD3AUQ7_9AGAR|nr:hypothetical protein BDN72DRAFT_897360 [Pluteus cervinus]